MQQISLGALQTKTIKELYYDHSVADYPTSLQIFTNLPSDLTYSLIPLPKWLTSNTVDDDDPIR